MYISSFVIINNNNLIINEIPNMLNIKSFTNSKAICVLPY